MTFVELLYFYTGPGGKLREASDRSARARVCHLYLHFLLLACAREDDYPSPTVAPIYLGDASATQQEQQALREALEPWPRSSALEAGKIPSAASVNKTYSLAELNEAALSFVSDYESNYYPSKETSTSLGWPEELPNFCVALSGGGLRSAAFSMGALQGLERVGLMDDI